MHILKVLKIYTFSINQKLSLTSILNFKVIIIIVNKIIIKISVHALLHIFIIL